jgi:ABC-type multidrug transport system fused ATPase/permease subunit
MNIRRGRRRQNTWWFFRDLPRIFPYLRPYWKLALGSLLIVAAGALVGLAAPWPLAILVDSVFGDEPLPSILEPIAGGLSTYQLLAFIVVGGFLLVVAENALGVIDNYVNVKLEQRMILDLRSDMFQQAHRLSLAYHDKRAMGGLMYQINDQASAVGAITVSIPPLLQALLTLIGMFVVTYVLDAELALYALTVVPLVYLAAGFYARKIEPRLVRVTDLETQSLSIVQEAMSMVRVILAFGRERHEFRRFRHQGETAVDARVDLTVRQTVFSLAVNSITAVGVALVLGVGGMHVLQGDLSPGDLLVILSYVTAIYAPLEQISNTVSMLQQQFVGLRGAMRVLDMEPEVKESPRARRVERSRGRVVFEDVTFAYDGRAAALESISFRAEAGERVAIVGPTGAGKSTLVSLIPRFYDPRIGRITLDGEDVRGLTLASLREQISIVLQEPLLFSGTIADNIRYGRLDASMGEIVEAAKAANAHAFVARLPEGYDTELGERGAQLSGGERQRIAVARAFLKDAPILILDEPTSSIDSRTEAVILDALDRLTQNRTSFTIAHRLSTVREVDRILVLDHGQLVEHGTHEELLAADGLFRQLHEAQIGEATAAGAPA